MISEHAAKSRVFLAIISLLGVLCGVQYFNSLYKPRPVLVKVQPAKNQMQSASDRRRFLKILKVYFAKSKVRIQAGKYARLRSVKGELPDSFQLQKGTALSYYWDAKCLKDKGQLKRAPAHLQDLSVAVAKLPLQKPMQVKDLKKQVSQNRCLLGLTDNMKSQAAMSSPPGKSTFL